MTTSPDTVNAAEATTAADATNANQATPASAGTTGGTVTATARTQPRPAQRPGRTSRTSRSRRPSASWSACSWSSRSLALVAAVPLLWGWGLGWHDVADRRSSSTGLRARHHGRLPPLLHPRLVQGQAPACGSRSRSPAAWRSRARSSRWVADHRRHHAFTDKEGDPHSPWRYGDDRAGAGQGPAGTRTSAGCSTPSRPTQEQVRPRPARRPRTSCGSTGCSRGWSLVSLLLPAADRRPVDDVLAGRADRVLLGQPGAGRAAAPRHLVDQLDLPHDRRAAVRSPRQVGATSGWLAILVVRRVLAQPAPRRPDLRPARRAARPDRLQRPASSGCSRSSAGPTTCAGRTRTGSRPSVPPRRRRTLGSMTTDAADRRDVTRVPRESR